MKTTTTISFFLFNLLSDSTISKIAVRRLPRERDGEESTPEEEISLFRRERAVSSRIGGRRRKRAWHQAGGGNRVWGSRAREPVSWTVLCIPNAYRAVARHRMHGQLIYSRNKPLLLFVHIENPRFETDPRQKSFSFSLSTIFDVTLDSLFTYPSILSPSPSPRRAIHERIIK